MNYRRIILIALISIGLLSIPSSYAATKKAPMSFLFVIEAAHGSLKHLSEKRYQLKIPAKDVKNILAFSDRPHRVVLKMTPQAYEKQAYVGKNSFAKNPPNLVLTWGHQLDEAAVYELLSYRRQPGYLIYELLYLGPKDNQVDVPQMGKLALFIDSSHILLPDQDTDIASKVRDLANSY